MPTIKVICWSCKGTRKSSNGRDCIWCNGTGYEELTEEQARQEALRKEINKSREL